MKAKFGAFKGTIDNDQVQSQRKTTTQDAGNACAGFPPGNANKRGEREASTPADETFTNERPSHILPDHMPKLPLIQIRLFPGTNKGLFQFIELLRAVVDNLERLQYLLGGGQSAKEADGATTFSVESTTTGQGEPPSGGTVKHYIHIDLLVVIR